MTDVNVLLFDGFETLDACGPIEMLGWVEGHDVKLFSADGGAVASKQGLVAQTRPAAEAGDGGVLLVPGGGAVRQLKDDVAFLALLRELADRADYVLSICTGAVLLASAGLLDGRRATSNKRAFDLALAASNRVEWVPRARWVADGRFYTSSGVSAGTDMALGFISDRLGRAEADRIAEIAEYTWNPDSTNDPFAVDQEI